MPDKWAPSRIGMFTPGALSLARLPLTFEISSLVSARDPSLPRVARFFLGDLRGAIALARLGLRR
jgi:hypothetical protein